MKSSLSRVALHWLPPVFVAALIFGLSSIPDLKSGLQPLYDLIFRKIAHTLIFGTLSFLVIRAIYFGHKLKFESAVIFASAVAIAYAVYDEHHQTFVFARHGAFTDVLIDTIGVLAAVIVAHWLWYKVPTKIKNNKKSVKNKSRPRK